MTNEQDLFNRQQLEENHRGVEDLLPTTISDFLEHFPDMLQDLQIAYSEGTQDTLTRAAHSLKGAIASVCSDSVKEVAFTIEKLSRENKREEIEPHLQELELKLKHLEKQLASFQQEFQGHE